MRLALIRHGLTIGNVYKAYVGRTDQPLCAEGRREIEVNVRNGVYPVVGAVYVSPLLRCMQTAQLIYPEMQHSVVPDLCERDFGRFDGMNHEEITSLPGYTQWGIDADSMQFPDGEDWSVFENRSCNAFLSILSEANANPKRSAAVICHGGTIMAVIKRFIVPDSNLYDWQCKTGCGFLISIDTRSGQIKVSRRIGVSS